MQGSSLLHSAHRGEVSFSWPLPLLSPAFTRGGNLDFNADLRASFLLPWEILIGRFQLFIYQIYKMLILPRSLGTGTRVKMLTSNNNKNVHTT